MLLVVKIVWMLSQFARFVEKKWKIICLCSFVEEEGVVVWKEGLWITLCEEINLLYSKCNK